MIRKEEISEVIQSCFGHNGIFIVDVFIKPQNRIFIEVDKYEGITIDECAEINRKVEAILANETENFELQVSSPGLGTPFKVKGQYLKNIGKKVEIRTSDKKRLSGILMAADENGIEMHTEKVIKNETTRKKEKITVIQKFAYSELEWTKEIIEFK